MAKTTEDQFIDQATEDESVSLLGNTKMSPEQVKEVQAGLNLLGAVFPKDQADDLKLDGVFGPKTYSRFKQFYTGLPKSTQAKLPAQDNPLLDVDGKIV